MPDPSVDIAELEMAFAKDPTSDAFLALSAAYLEQGRFMEAMVVCKKGIKSQPANLDGRILLARVYAGQGKVPKAIDEVKALLALAPATAQAHFFLGQLHERSGRFEEAIESFKTALEHEPTHAEAIAALKAKGIEVAPPKPAAPPPAPASPAPAAENGAAADAPAAAANESRPPAPSAQPAGAPTPATGVSSAPAPARAPRRQPMAPAGGYQSPIMGGYDPLAMQASRTRKLGLGFTVGLGGVLLVVLFGFILFLRAHKMEAEEIAELVRQASKVSVGGNTAGLVKATEKLEDALKIDDEQPTVAANLAYLYALLTAERGMRGSEDKAKEALARAVKVADEHPLTLAARMLRALYTGKTDEAAKVLAIIEKDLSGGQPKPVLNVARGQYYRQTGKLNELAPVLESLRNTATDPNHLAWLGFAYRTLGDRTRARLALDQAIKTKGDNDPARAQRALLIMEQRDVGNIPIALDDLTTLQDLGKNSVGERQWGYMSIARGELNRFNEREQEYQRDINAARSTLGAKDPDLLFFEARALYDQDKESAAVAKLQEATQIDRHRLLTWSTLVTVAADANKGKEAEAALTEAKGLFPDHVELAVAEVYLLAKQKQFDKAKSMLEEKLKAKEDAELRAELGRVLLAQNSAPQAIEELRKAAEAADKSKSTLVRASIYTLLGRALATNDDDANAVEAYSAAIGVNSGYADAYYYLGGSLQRQGRNGPAREAYEKYVKLDPTGSKAAAAKERAAALR